MVNVNIIVNTIVKKNNNVFCGWVVSYTRTSYVESIKGVQKVTERDSFIRMCCLLGLFHSYVLHLGTPSFMCVASIKGIYMCCIYKGCTQSLCPRLLQVYVLAYVLPHGTPSFICVASWDSFIHMWCLFGTPSIIGVALLASIKGAHKVFVRDSFKFMYWHMCCLLRLFHPYVLPHGTPSFICVASWDSFIHMMCCLMGLLHSYDVLPLGTPSFICIASIGCTQSPWLCTPSPCARLGLLNRYFYKDCTQSDWLCTQSHCARLGLLNRYTRSRIS